MPFELKTEEEWQRAIGLLPRIVRHLEKNQCAIPGCGCNGHEAHMILREMQGMVAVFDPGELAARQILQQVDDDAAAGPPKPFTV